MGTTIDGDETVYFTFVLRRDQREMLGRLARERQTNVATVVREAVREYLSRVGTTTEAVAA